MVDKLGHQARIADAAPAAEGLEGAAVLIVEPADPKGALLAKTAHTSAPELPVLCVSVLDPSEVDIEYAAFLSKPFTVEQLASAIEQALRRQGASDQASV